MAITKDPRNTDPACSLSPYHNEMVKIAKQEAARPSTEFVYRNTRNAAQVGKAYGEELVPAQ
jgi:pyrroloquinoline quinone biosynthesis protein E